MYGSPSLSGKGRVNRQVKRVFRSRYEGQIAATTILSIAMSAIKKREVETEQKRTLIAGSPVSLALVKTDPSLPIHGILRRSFSFNTSGIDASTETDMIEVSSSLCTAGYG